ncbi:anhydro-N-acetylmuramic acid kinase [Noviherbaspirillum sp.]|uniref:anhydro-N-acetylmuramic acid kinase n=1 Tax=Noviherbaspirillum sp. TaxID=1926288 RepID=UPI002B46F2D3|nr:anhydro-N-acetylmuramic acid kinase [Noviherbaspirillum sp.]HJV81126.1 anhydro-N-acetylmuramic acid kinase [Noviherbaspirillum sp.]
MSGTPSHLFIGLMSGTSLDGVDGVLAAFPVDDATCRFETLSTAYLPFPAALRSELMTLQAPCENELHREALAANDLAGVYAECVAQLLAAAGKHASHVTAIGAHGQTIRHRPELGFTRQTNNPALLTELTGIDVIADFRSRDIAAGGQGAPLVPAFHQAIFGSSDEIRVVANIGGISNISVLEPGQKVIGFDTGPGNVLMDAWIARHQGRSYDADGAWGATGQVMQDLLDILLAEPYLALPPPKSTGRDLFHAEWLENRMKGFGNANAVDVQATLTAFTASTLANAIATHARKAKAVYVCGGGAYNLHLMRTLQRMLDDRRLAARVSSTEALGVSPNHVEALAFAWLAQRHVEGMAGNLPTVTGAQGFRILGARYPR